ncbi:hypothetical protein [Mangrovimonas sp. TPBH4]|uniref:hypothetical protein n=1 Tax=Mangrovimonas sp. TPBH4 TaxID=1645914 RepID=UPI0006B58C24|nr:hypothetical protein [Mangrovimonas sp. TPBH4]
MNTHTVTGSRSNIKSFEHYFFSISAILFFIICVLGFTPNIFRRVDEGNMEVYPLLVMHSLSATLWLLVFIAQTQFVFWDKFKYHPKIGRWAVLILLVWIISSIFISLTDLSKFGYPDNFFTDEKVRTRWGRLMGNDLLDFLYTAGMITIGIINRKRPFLHKRFIYYGTLLMVGAGITRLPVAFGMERGDFSFVLPLLLPLPLLVYDLISQKKINFKVWALSLFLLKYSDGQAYRFLNRNVFNTPEWIDFCIAINF